MPTLISIKTRIKAIKNTSKITKAMELVSASKMKSAESVLRSQNMYMHHARRILSELAIFAEKSYLFQPNRSKTKLVLVLASDRGLAGSYNNNVFKKVLTVLRENSIQKYEIITVGKRASSFISKLEVENIELSQAYSFDETTKGNLEQNLLALYEYILAGYKKQKWSHVEIIYTNFISVIKQDISHSTVLPLQKPKKIETPEKDIFEPRPEAIFGAVAERFVLGELIKYFSDSRASEHALRMLSMKNASDNADDIGEDLRLLANSVRQAKITSELAEINAGKAAVS